MKRHLNCIGILFFLFQINSNNAKTAVHQVVVDKIVNKVLEVQPGEVVMISGTPAEIEMLEDNLVAVAKAGGKPIAAMKKAIEMSSDGVDVLSMLDIGLNPNCHPIAGSDYLSWEMAGMVTLGIGANEWAGEVTIQIMHLCFIYQNLL